MLWNKKSHLKLNDVPILNIIKTKGSSCIVGIFKDQSNKCFQPVQNNSKGLKTIQDFSKATVENIINELD